jgi:hypothetical protein
MGRRCGVFLGVYGRVAPVGGRKERDRETTPSALFMRDAEIVFWREKRGRENRKLLKGGDGEREAVMHSNSIGILSAWQYFFSSIVCRARGRDKRFPYRHPEEMLCWPCH